VPAGWYVDSGEPVTLGEDSEPEPDVVVVRGNTRDYRDQHPGAGDLALAVDVVEAPGSDLEARKRVYARAGVPVCWVINLADTRIEVYSDLAITAGEAGYRRRTDFTASDEIPVVIEGREVRRFTVRELTSL
jgi:Uma2 family endonuclease